MTRTGPRGAPGLGGGSGPEASDLGRRADRDVPDEVGVPGERLGEDHVELGVRLAVREFDGWDVERRQHAVERHRLLRAAELALAGDATRPQRDRLAPAARNGRLDLRSKLETDLLEL